MVIMEQQFDNLKGIEQQKLISTIRNMIDEYELPIKISEHSDAWYWVDIKECKRIIKFLKNHINRNNIIYYVNRINDYALHTYYIELHLHSGAIGLESEHTGMFLTKDFNEFMYSLYGFYMGLKEHRK